MAELHPQRLVCRPMSFIQVGHMVTAATASGDGPHGAYETPEPQGAVLIIALHADHDEAQVLCEAGVVPPEVRIGAEDAWAEHRHLHREAQEEKEDEEPHGLILLRMDPPHQRGLLDVALRGAHGKIDAASPARSATAAAHRHTSVVEGRRCHLLPRREVLEVFGLVEGAIHSAGHEIQRPLRPEAPVRLHVDATGLPQNHGLFGVGIEDCGALLLLLTWAFHGLSNSK